MFEGLTTAWKAQFEVSPNIPLEWTVKDEILYLDGICICPLNDIVSEGAHTIGRLHIILELKDSWLEIEIYEARKFGKFEIVQICRSMRLR